MTTAGILFSLAGLAIVLASILSNESPGGIRVVTNCATYQADDAPRRMKPPNEELWAFKEHGGTDLILIHGDFTVRLPGPADGGK